MYVALVSEVVKKQIKAIPSRDLQKIKDMVLELSHNTRPKSCKMLVAGQQEYRVRHRHWRILYSVDDRQKQVVVYGVLQRKEAYR